MEQSCLTEQLARATCQGLDLPWRQQDEDDALTDDVTDYVATALATFWEAGLDVERMGRVRGRAYHNRGSNRISQGSSPVCALRICPMTYLYAGEANGPFRLLHHGGVEPSRAHGSLAVGC